jgi:hypothetical protein
MDPLTYAVLSTHGKPLQMPSSRGRRGGAGSSARPRSGNEHTRRSAQPALARYGLRASLRSRAAAALRWAADQLDGRARSRSVPQPGTPT